MRKNEKGFGAVEIILIVAVIGLMIALGWQFLSKQQSKITDKDSKTNDGQTCRTETTAPDPTRVAIYPDQSPCNDFFTLILPDGWSVENIFEPYDIVKTIGNDRYLISSFIEEDSDRHIMQQRVAEGIEVVEALRTSRGTSVSVLKTPTTLFLASCRPTGDNCYLQLNGNKLYIHLYQLIPGAQTATEIDYSTESAKEIINDLKSIAASLSL
jgi:hypothetical protein